MADIEKDIANIEKDIAKFMLTVSKFEFFLTNENIELPHIKEKNGLQKITGIDWRKLAVLIEEKHPFSNFNFENSQFCIFQKTPPQFLVKSKDGKPKWDSDECKIDSWDKLLTRGFAQLRNNIAHGNKSHLPAPFTQGNTEKFIDAGYALIQFIAQDIFKSENWETEISFKN